jgi:hypothetical protein
MDNRRKGFYVKRHILLRIINDGWLYGKEQIHDGITDSESCLQDMKRK